MKRNLLVVERFVDSIGEVDDGGDFLFDSFKKSSVVSLFYKNNLSRRVFEVNLRKVCEARGGRVFFASSFDKRFGRRHYFLQPVSQVVVSPVVENKQLVFQVKEVLQ